MRIAAPLRLAAAIGISVALVAALYLVLLLPLDAVRRCTVEDGPIETVGALGLLAAATFSVLAWRRRQDLPRIARGALLALAALFVFGAGEEVSWGQRILGLETPEKLRRSNTQGEITLHNWEGMAGLLDLDYAFRNFWILFGVLVPLVALWSRARVVLARVVPIVPIWVSAALVVNQLIAGLAERAARRVPGASREFLYLMKDATVETKETAACLLLAAGMFAVYRSLPLVPTGPSPRSDAPPVTRP